MLYREVVTAFEEWFSGANKKALFVQGARQVGTTTTIREFCRTHYENLIEINFIKKTTAKRAFDGDLDADTIILNLSAMGYGLFVKGKTAVFLDEIQECPNARTAIKFLVEDGSYDYIESGSLSGVNYKNSSDGPEDSALSLTRYHRSLPERTNALSWLILKKAQAAGNTVSLPNVFFLQRNKVTLRWGTLYILYIR